MAHGNNAPYRVVLPNWMYEKARDREQFMKLLNGYMKSYPDLVIKKIENHMAICERLEDTSFF